MDEQWILMMSQLVNIMSYLYKSGLSRNDRHRAVYRRSSSQTKVHPANIGQL